jgi:hypothetical protein
MNDPRVQTIRSAIARTFPVDESARRDFEEAHAALDSLAADYEYALRRLMEAGIEP